MPRIDTNVPAERWAYACPSPGRHRDWRVVDGHFHCRRCDETYERLVDLETNDYVHRDEFEFVGDTRKQERETV